MGVTNYDSLLENQAAHTLREAAQTASERKAMQRIGGSSLRYYRTNNAGSYAWSGRLDTVSAQSSTTGLARFLVNFTSSANEAFMSSIVVEVEQSTDGVTWTPLPWSTSPVGGFDWQVQDAGVVNTEAFNAKYDLFLRGPLNAYRRFKIQALTSDPVSISLTRTL
ncbi:hypothetical protein [Arthrobacter sp. KNU40]|uniref:hypothetical protein n=1 Tax=Arthrobacter sp. KNU40 TaxID=3447965 RepID=UPI003F5ECC7A